MENTFWEMCTEIGFNHLLTQKKHWEPWKFFTDKYGDEEAQEMLDDGKLDVTADRIAPPNRRNVANRWGVEMSRRGAKRCLVGARRNVDAAEQGGGGGRRRREEEEQGCARRNVSWGRLQL